MPALIMKSLFLIAVFCLFSIPATVVACVCGTREPTYEFNGARLVFIGRMLGGTEKLSLNQQGKPYVIEAGQVRFAVEELFKGVEAEEVTILIDSNKGTSCGPYGLKRGERYLVYAYPDQKNEKVLYTGVCTRTKLTSAEYAKEDLEFLRNLPPPGVGGNITGLIYEDTRGGGDKRLPDVRVKISNTSGQVITAFTDKRGEFEVKQLKAGKYKVEPDFPPNYTSEQRLVEIDVDDRGTADVTFVVYVDGRVSGRVVDSQGHVFNSAYLDMIGGGKTVSGLSIAEDGTFEVEGAPPGNYLLTMELQNTDQTKKTLYYYPGTFDRQKATPIRVGLGEKISGLEFVLPPDFLVRTIEGEVVWKDGSPAADVEVLLLCPRSSTPEGLVIYFYSRGETDAEGRFRIEAFTGESYIMQARARKEGKKEDELVEMHSLPQKISTGESVKGLKLRLSEKGYFGRVDCPK